jgi:hypothetical protein
MYIANNFDIAVQKKWKLEQRLTNSPVQDDSTDRINLFVSVVTLLFCREQPRKKVKLRMAALS